VKAGVSELLANLVAGWWAEPKLILPHLFLFFALLLVVVLTSFVVVAVVFIAVAIVTACVLIFFFLFFKAYVGVVEEQLEEFCGKHRVTSEELFVEVSCCHCLSSLSFFCSSNGFENSNTNNNYYYYY
jgi:hypothetical protein